MDHSHPPAEVHVDAALAAALVQARCPEFLDGPPVLVDEGWDNVTFRLGGHHALRLPRREAAVQLLVNEQRWLPKIAAWLSLDVPRSVFHGEPSDLFSWPWSVVRWVDGSTLHDAPLDGSSAAFLARELRSLHRPAADDAPYNPFRGVRLAERNDVVEPRVERLGVAGLHRLWRDALAVVPSTERVWLHGDLHPRNVVVRNGRLAGLIDWGDLNGGDRSTDLACAWTLFERPAREVFLGAYAPTEAELVRAAGWAVNFGAGLIDSGEPRHVPLGRDIVRRLTEPGGVGAS